MKTIRFVDLFSGLGGFHIALARLGGKCVFAAEREPHLQDLYQVNFSIRPSGDIRLVKAREIPDHDVLTAGFPCQPFSKAGEQLGFECTDQGSLFHNVAAILREKKPMYFILENVPNLMKHDSGNTWSSIRVTLEKLGYEVDVAKLSPHNFGIPQIRDRVYIVGSRRSLRSFEWPNKLDAETSIQSVLDVNPANAKTLSAQVQNCLDVWKTVAAQI